MRRLKPTLPNSDHRIVRSLLRALRASALIIPCALPFAADPPATTPPRLWQPLADDVFLQEVGRKVPSTEPLSAVAVFSGQVFVGSEKGLSRLDGEKFVPVAGLTEPVVRLVAARDALWVIARKGLFRHQSGAVKKVSEEVVADVTGYLGQTVAASGNRLWQVEGDGLKPLVETNSPFAITRVLSHNRSLYVQGGNRLTFVDGDRFGGFDAYGFPADQGWDWGDMPSSVVRDALSFGSRIYFATDRGLGELRGMSLTAIRGEQGLCFEDTTCLATGFTNDLWIGTTRGAIRMVNGRFNYFAGQRWLPDDRVQSIAVGSNAVYLATGKGLGVIEYEPYTLLKKADCYERHLDEWGQRRLGVMHKLEWDDTLQEFVREAGDNDGGYSGDYLAAQSYRYAVTKDPEARALAANTFRTLRWFETMTGIPGFPARSVWVKGERGHKATGGSGGYPAEWHDSKDAGFEWKGDTSSDELCSHFYAVTIFHELAAEGAEKEQAKAHLASIATHLIDHQWQLIDVDGKPTRWGRWDTNYFLTDGGRNDRGLQALEILSFMKTAAALTGDPKFDAAYRRLVEMGYPGYLLRQRNTPPPPENIAHFDNQLALWCYWNLLRFEQDPALYATYRRSLERTYEVIRIEQNPWFNFVYGALTGNDCEVGPAVNHLREWPLDLVIWSYQNSHRADLKTPAGYRPFTGGTRAFPARETEPLRWDHWTMQADGGSGGKDVVEPSGWLVAYWMGRYFGFIEAPRVTDPGLVSVERNRGKTFGARPYNGPARPESF